MSTDRITQIDVYSMPMSVGITPKKLAHRFNFDFRPFIVETQKDNAFVQPYQRATAGPVHSSTRNRI